MRTPTGLAHSPSTRQGFSLVELLVVITIIAILAALSTAAVFRVRGEAKRTAVVSDISNMNTACSKFKRDFGFNVPQVFTFPTSVPNPGVTSAANDAGFAVFKSMFRAYAGGLAAGTNLPAVQFGSKPNMNGQTITGSQCLLFFLGGPNLQGFDPTGPTSPAGTSKKVRIWTSTWAGSMRARTASWITGERLTRSSRRVVRISTTRPRR